MDEIEIKTPVKDSHDFNYTRNLIDQIDYCEITYDQFFTNYMLKNLPCIIKNVSSEWVCHKNWTKDGKIAHNYFIENYGDLEAPVADCGKVNFNAHCKINMKIDTYMKYLASEKKDKLLYLKDWHLQRFQPNDTFYEVPFIFASDWLNEFAVDNEEDDFMFVYIGPKDTWTPLHADVYNSYSWSVNVVGRKKWILFPPGEEGKLKDSLGNLPLLFDSNGTSNVKYFEIIQEQGDAIFVPSGWFHQVVNLLDTISINHNWINACNIEHVWNALQSNLSSVEKEIEEFKDTPEYYLQCQLILKSLFGMDIITFIKFLCYISKKRIKQLENRKSLRIHNFILGENHIKFDIQVLLKIMDSIDKNQIFILNIDFPSDIINDYSNTKVLLSNIIRKEMNY